MGLATETVVGDFIDMGRYPTLYATNKVDAHHNVLIGDAISLDEESTHNLIINQLDQPLTVIGMHNSVIVQNKNGSLVAPLKMADTVKLQVSKTI
jgi:mannose-1-phosphate guanylyltransferase